jgi:hypothetical protein
MKEALKVIITIGSVILGLLLVLFLLNYANNRSKQNQMIDTYNKTRIEGERQADSIVNAINEKHGLD